VTITFIRGDTVTITFTFSSGGVAVDLTDSKAYFTVKKSTDDAYADALIAKTWTSHTTPTSGITTLILSSTDTDITPGLYVFDAQIKDSSDNIFSILPGTCKVLADVTDSTA